MSYNHLLGEIGPRNRIFFFNILPLFWAHSEGGWLCHSCAALQARGRWEDAVPQAGEGERLQQHQEGVWLFSQQQKLILAGKLEVRRARQTSQAEFHSPE